jgi:tetratricopeptide (TPR) repeat protein
VLGNLGLVHDAARRLEDAVVRYEAALAVARRIGDLRSEGQFLGHLALTQARQGDFDVARAGLDRALALLGPLADQVSMGLVWCQRAECEWLAGQALAARRALDEATALARACAAGARSELGLALARLRTLMPPDDAPRAAVVAEAASRSG